MSFAFHMAGSIRFGSTLSTTIMPEVAKLLGPRILFITDPGLMAIGLTDSCRHALEQHSHVLLFDQIEADPSRQTLEKAIAVGRSEEVTGIIGFGGGSSMDVAKLAALILGSGEDLDASWGVGLAKGPRLPLALVPTTSGTGSEVTTVSIITVDENEKRGVSSPIILPDLAILDPDLTMDLPPAITAATGIDAMVHAIESYTSTNANRNLISDMMAKRALELLGGAIERAVHQGHDAEARGDMLLGSMLAGMAFANSPVAAVHALAYPIGGMFHIPHGLSNALVLPEVMRFNAYEETATRQYAELAPFVFPALAAVDNDKARCRTFIDSLAALSGSLGLPQRLRDVDIPHEACAAMARDAMKQTRLLVNNPRPVTQQDAHMIYEAVW